MSKKPLITAIITTYQRPDFLVRAIESVQKQTIFDLSILVSDSASNDQTQERVEKMIEKDPRIIYHRHPQVISSVENYQFGINRANTPFFSILSDDDLLYPTFYEKGLRLLQKYPQAQFFLGSTIDISLKGDLLSAEALKWPNQELFLPQEGLKHAIESYFNWTGSIYRTKIGQKHLLDPEIIPVDYDFTLRLAAKYPFTFSLSPSAFFTHHPGSFSASCGLKLIAPSFSRIADKIYKLRPIEERAQLQRCFDASFKAKLLQIGLQKITQNRLEELDPIIQLIKKKKFIFFLQRILIACLSLAKISPVFHKIFLKIISSYRHLKSRRLQRYFFDLKHKKWICMALHSFHVGGCELQLLSLAQALQKQGQNIMVLYSSTRNSLPPPFIEGIKFIKIPWLFQKFRAAGLYLSYLFKIRLKTNPALFHCHAISPFVDQVLKFAQKKKIPTIVKATVEKEISKIKTFNSMLKRLLFAKTRPPIYAKVDRYISISRSIAKELEAFPIDKAKIIEIPNGVDSTRFKPISEIDVRGVKKELGLPLDQQYIIMVARFTKRKRYQDLILAWSKIAPDHAQYTLLLVGDGIERPKCEQLAEKLNLSSRVIFTGAQQRIEKYLQASTLFVFTSEREGLPNAVLEAMAAALPVIAADVGGVQEIIKTSQNGILVQPKDIEALADAIKALLNAPEERKKLGAAARSAIINRYEFDQIIPQFISLYNNLKVIHPPRASKCKM